jgi:hypothetical protein
MNLPVIQIGFVGFASIIALRMWRAALAARREQFIRTYTFPPWSLQALPEQAP